MACCLTAPSHYLKQCWLAFKWDSVAFTWERFVSRVTYVLLCCINPCYKEVILYIVLLWVEFLCFKNLCCEEIASIWFTPFPLWNVTDFIGLIFKCIVLITFLFICKAFTFGWMAHNPADDKATLVQVMAWCHQAPSHYLNHCWLKSTTPYGITRP